MKAILTFFILFPFLSSYCQQAKIDSLIIVYKKQTEDTIRLKIMSQICAEYYFSKPHEGLVYVDTLSALARKTGKLRWISFGYRFRGLIHINNGEFDKARDEFLKSISFLDSIGRDDKSKYPDFVNLATVFRYDRKFDSASKYYSKSLDIALKTDSQDRLTSLYNNLGTLEYSRENHKKAVEYFLKAMDYSEVANSPIKVVSTYVNLGNVFIQLEEGDTAIEYLNEALELSYKINYLQGIADSKRNLAKCYNLLNIHIEKSIEYLKDAVEIYKDIKDDIFLLEAYSNLGEAYQVKGSIYEAIKYHELAVSLSEQVEMEVNVFGSHIALGSAYFDQNQLQKAVIEIDFILQNIDNKNLLKNNLLTAYELKSKISKRRENYVVALDYFEKFKNLSDSLISVEKMKNIQEIDTKYQSEKKENENIKLKNENAEQELEIQKEISIKQRYGFLAGGSVLGVFALVFYYRNRRKRLMVLNRFQIVEAKQKEHQRIGADLHDSKAKTLEKIAMALDENGNSEIADRVRAVKENIRVLSHELLQIPFTQEEFDEQIITLLYEYNNVELKINYIGIKAIEWKTIDDAVKRNLYLVINEAVSNIKNHSGATEAEIKFEKKRKQLAIYITDNGRGYQDSDLTNGFGFSNMKMRIHEINGSIKFDSIQQKGTEIGIFLSTY
jgi:signal transduction histidine kinase